MDNVGWSVLVMLLLALAIGGTLAYRRWRSRRRRRRSGGDILLVYPVASNGRARSSNIVPATFMPQEPADQPDGLTTPTPGPVDRLPADYTELVEGRTVLFQRPDPSAMRRLPGRLEVVEGEEDAMEIYFFDLPGQPREIGFGRSEGPYLRHVQLKSPTVSRSHARMTWEDTGWVLTNLSSTNPVVVNDVQLGGPGERHVLRNGDKIEMGEVVFRYHGS